jgi:hypothetical protein
MPDVFDRLDPKDGFHVVLAENAGLLGVYCVCYAGGEVTNPFVGAHYGDSPEDPLDGSVMIQCWPSPTEGQRGQAIRLQLVLDAVARYLTTGGRWRDLYDAVKLMEPIAVGGIDFGDFHLVESYVTTEGVYQHVFAKEGGEAILWEEPTQAVSGGLVGGFIDRTTLEAIREAQENDGWEEEGGGDEPDGEGGGTPDLPRLGSS